MRVEFLFLALTVLFGSMHCRTVIHDDVGVRVIEDDAEQPEASPRRLQTSTLQALLDRHNSDRATTAAGNTPGQPGATSMPALVWDAGLATVAQNYANKCIWGHNSARTNDYKNTNGALKGSYVGENLYASSATGQAASIVPNAGKSWYDEYVDYTYSTKQCAAGKQCGHYTQVVWAKTTLLGCAYAECTNGLQGISWSKGTIVVCNYAVGGNYNNEFPYVQGSGGNNPSPTPRPTVPVPQPTPRPTVQKPTVQKPTVKPTVQKPTNGGPKCTGLTGTRTTYIRNTSPLANCGDYETALERHLPCVKATCIYAQGYPGLESYYQQVRMSYVCDRDTWNRGGTDFRNGIETQLQLMGFKFAGASSTGGQTPTETSSVTSSSESKSGNNGNTTGVIVGAVIGSVCVLVLIGAVVFVVLRKRSRDKMSEYQMMNQQGNYHPPAEPLIS